MDVMMKYGPQDVSSAIDTTALVQREKIPGWCLQENTEADVTFWKSVQRGYWKLWEEWATKKTKQMKKQWNY